MQISAASQTDPELTKLVTENAIGWAVASKVSKVEKQQGEAAVELIQTAADIASQLDQNRIDVKL